jgi:hypothetical protein
LGGERIVSVWDVRESPLGKKREVVPGWKARVRFLDEQRDGVPWMAGARVLKQL